MLNPVYENNFKKDVIKMQKRGFDIEKLKSIIDMLIDEKPLPVKYKNHKLQGNYKGYWECHIMPDWLLVYQKTKTDIIFSNTGTHSDLF